MTLDEAADLATEIPVSGGTFQPIAYITTHATQRAIFDATNNSNSIYVTINKAIEQATHNATYNVTVDAIYQAIK